MFKNLFKKLRGNFLKVLKKFKKLLPFIFLSLIILTSTANIGGFLVTKQINNAEVVEETGFAYIYQFKNHTKGILKKEKENSENNIDIQTKLYENDILLGPKRSPHNLIRSIGAGTYSDWQDQIYFSTSDNSSPLTNNRIYKVEYKIFLSNIIAIPAYFLFSILFLSSISLFFGGKKKIDLLEKNFKLKMSFKLKDQFKTNFLKGFKKKYGRELVSFFSFLILAIITFKIALNLNGILFLSLILATLCLYIWLFKKFLIFISLLLNIRWTFEWVNNILLILISSSLAFIGFEGYLNFLEPNEINQLLNYDKDLDAYRKRIMVDKPKSNKTLDNNAINEKFSIPESLRNEIQRKKSMTSLPLEWQLKYLDIPNTNYSFSWHGITHIHDENGYRRKNDPYPKKDKNTYRIIVLGDSLAYGYAIEKKWRVGDRLEKALNMDYNVEVITLAASGDQTEDILYKLKNLQPKLNPDLILYVFVPNDFLPSQVGQYQRDLSLPLPKKYKDYLNKKLRLFQVVDTGYKKLLIKSGVGLDFTDDILQGIDNYQTRFQSDVKDMNDIAINNGLPPIIAVTTEVFAQYGGRNHSVALLAQRLMEEVGVDVVDPDLYFKKYDGRGFTISKFEGHPDEEAHAIFASQLYDLIIKKNYLNSWKK